MIAVRTQFGAAAAAPRRLSSPDPVEKLEKDFVDTFLELAGKDVRPTYQRLEGTGVRPTTAAFLAVGGALAPALAMALAGTAFGQSQPHIAEIVDTPYRKERQELGTLAGDIKLFAHPEVAQAFTSGQHVYLNPQLTPYQGTAILDWIIGHELGHIAAGDGAAAIGRRFVLGQLSADGIQTAPFLAEHEELNREAEFVADQRGFDYAVARGHSRQEVLLATKAFLESLPGEDTATHPAPLARVERLREYGRG
ncbi:MAG: hypothetical protein HY319_20345 [Armatimonadetes bacterium]|nr:hypothetical protein [Armatimonadota bacterium]